MGIPLYFKIISDKFDNIIVDDITDKDSLFLDLNCAIHPCCRKILENFNSNDITKLENKMIHETLHYIEKLFNIVKPQFLYIAIDGVAPFAKMNQQRLRRYKSIQDRKKQNEIKKKYGEDTINTLQWDTNAISPGTKFMDKLCLKIRYELKNNKLYNNIKYYFSDIDEEGEGEHKIINYIKNNPLNNNIIIYGLDADLIMLSFVSHKNNIYLLREALEFGKPILNKFLYLNIDVLKYHIIKDIQNKMLSIDHTLLFDTDKLFNIMDDYIFICFMVGNDFLPNLLPYNLRNDGLMNLLNTYIEMYAIFNEHLVDIKHLKINFNFLKRFVNKIMEKEERLLQDMSYRRKKFRLNRHYKSDIEKELDLLNNYPILNQDGENLIKIGEKNWEPRYYKYCLKITDKNDIKECCLNYIEGLQWTFNYYFKGSITWKWKYNYNYSPTLKDINTYLTSIGNINSIKFKPDNAPCSTVQLLCILPKSSCYLIPDKYKKLMNETSDICDLYVNDYELDTYYKRYLWQCEPVLPFIDINRVIKSYKKIK